MFLKEYKEYFLCRALHKPFWILICMICTCGYYVYIFHISLLEVEDQNKPEFHHFNTWTGKTFGRPVPPLTATVAADQHGVVSSP